MSDLEVANQGGEAVMAAKNRPALLANSNLRLLWLGESVSLLGDQFYIVALSWLVLELTGSGVAVGTILAVAGIPRAILMLVGGVLTDRFSPRLLMLVSNAARVIITGLLTALVFTNTLQVWMLYIFALLFGIFDAFFQPAYMAIIPSIVEEDHLSGANALLQGTSLLVSAAGPGLAGILVKTVGIPFSFLLDTLSFIVATLTAAAMRPPHKSKHTDKPLNVWADIREAAAYIRQDEILRSLIPMITVINFLFSAPFTVGPALLAKDRFTEGSVALGLLLSGIGIGSLVGMIAAGTWSPKRFGMLTFGALGVAGIAMTLAGYTTALWVTVGLFIVIGITVGFTNLLFFTWLQKRISKEMMGRVMSMVMLSSVGLMPISAALGGVIGEWNLTFLFAFCGVVLVLISCAALLNPKLRNIRSGE